VLVRAVARTHVPLRRQAVSVYDGISRRVDVRRVRSDYSRFVSNAKQVFTWPTNLRESARRKHALGAVSGLKSSAGCSSAGAFVQQLSGPKRCACLTMVLAISARNWGSRGADCASAATASCLVFCAQPSARPAAGRDQGEIPQLGLLDRDHILHGNSRIRVSLGSTANSWNQRSRLGAQNTMEHFERIHGVASSSNRRSLTMEKRKRVLYRPPEAHQLYGSAADHRASLCCSLPPCDACSRTGYRPGSARHMNCSSADDSASR